MFHFACYGMANPDAILPWDADAYSDILGRLGSVCSSLAVLAMHAMQAGASCQ